MKGRHGAVTIVSKNYFALAATLAQSYKRHHPDHDFIIVLVDRADGKVPAELPGVAEVIEVAKFAIPDIARFIYRYTVMELNTAVKPFVLADLFENRGYETLLYIDPDIWVHRPMTPVYDALAEADIVLTPHMRRPYGDDKIPSDLVILQSGTYNLGFIGLRAGPSATSFLEWWTSKLYLDCVVDIANGLFVDQKWVDLVPAFFPSHRIIHDPTCNVAYWNLHERELTRDDSGWFVDGEPLTFYHFSGYLPFSPQTLSKHQNRHVLARMPALKALTDAYSAALMANGYAESNAWPYAFATLANGVKLPLELVRDVMQWAAREHVPTPCPVTEPDAFCRFLMSRGALPGRPGLTLLLHFLLKRRGDVAGAFPGAQTDSDDPDFRAWLEKVGRDDFELDDLLAFEQAGVPVDYVAEVFGRLRKAGRKDILEKHEDLWTRPAAFEEFATWVATRGTKQMRFDRVHAEHLRQAYPALMRIVNIYFLRGDLQARYPALARAGQLDGLVHWLRDNRFALDLTQEEISLFAEFAAASADQLEVMRFLYLHRGKPSGVLPGIYAIESRQREIGGVLANKRLASFFANSKRIDPADHFHARFGDDATALESFEALSVEDLPARDNFTFVTRLRQSLAARKPEDRRVNVAGFLDAPSGMGESARSLAASLAATPAITRSMALPHPQGGVGATFDPLLFGWPQGGADVSVCVANADCAGQVDAFLPRSFWAKRDVGYWVWETEELPARFKDGERLFDEIWTPSRFSADAIAKTVSCPVRVLPHTLDFPALDRARANRARYGLPETGLLFGFAFDPLSVLERKNVRGLLRAFDAAFREDDDCYLVFKVNGNVQGHFDYEMLRARAERGRVLFFEGTLARDETYGFMKSLDAYVSLHRAEGFGLTCAEAMALGLPVVASGYSGNLEFMDKDNSLLVPTRVVETERAWGAYPAGSRWGDPDHEAAVDALRSLKDASRRLALGAAGAASVRTTLDTRAVGAAAWALIQQLTGRTDVQHSKRHRR